MTIQLFAEQEKLEEILNDLHELKCERDWWKDEPRKGYADEYKKLCGRIKFFEELIKK